MWYFSSVLGRYHYNTERLKNLPAKFPIYKWQKAEKHQCYQYLFPLFRNMPFKKHAFLGRGWCPRQPETGCLSGASRHPRVASLALRAIHLPPPPTTYNPPCHSERATRPFSTRTVRRPVPTFLTLSFRAEWNEVEESTHYRAAKILRLAALPQDDKVGGIMNRAADCRPYGEDFR